MKVIIRDASIEAIRRGACVGLDDVKTLEDVSLATNNHAIIYVRRGLDLWFDLDTLKQGENGTNLQIAQDSKAGCILEAPSHEPAFTKSLPQSTTHDNSNNSNPLRDPLCDSLRMSQPFSRKRTPFST
jgi:hypothetical protein